MLFIGDDWAEDHHDVELQDETGRVLVVRQLPEGIAGITKLHALVAEHARDQAGEDVDTGQVVVGIETDRGPWVEALIAAGYQVYAINPLQASRFKERYGTSRAKSDKGDAHALADMVRIDRAQLRPVAGDTEPAQAIKVVARAHQTMVGERTRTMLRLRAALREYFPAALIAYDELGLAGADTLELLQLAPAPDMAAALEMPVIAAALKRARRRSVAAKAEGIAAALRTEQLGRSRTVTAAYAAIVTSLAAVITIFNAQIKHLERQVESHFREHPAAEIYLSQPGIGVITGARVLAEFGDDPERYASAKARKNYAATSPITRASGKSRVVIARFVHNDRLVDALRAQAFSAINGSPGARAYYDKQRAREADHGAALRQVANRLVGILHGCLKTGTIYNEHTAWSHHLNIAAA
ncbi:IS110 family transposase [Herbidospora mongoliensis]|uniref:IS110 family transposase n=1 Tax=Herbidospora mongoliensis TaxID=688067 RepID=UPI00082965D9|nr:IS110 family transposase [Herbidospora mongoliensis]